MPGLSLRIKYNDKPDLSEEKYKEVINSLLHDSDFVNKELIKNSQCLAIFTGYEQYPLSKFENAEFEIFIEGKVYNKTEAELKLLLFQLTKIISSSSPETSINSWLKNLDGDFIILVFDKSLNKYVIINDILGRLPFYIHKDNDQVIISRELKFIFQQFPNKEVEIFGIAETLLLGYPLGERTFLKDIYRIQPASFISIEPKNLSCTVKQVADFNFEIKEQEGKKINTLVENLTDLFVEGTKNRLSKDDRNILSLSGGFDSRSVLGALKSIGKDFKAVTFSGYSKTSVKDSEVAKTFSENLGFQWELFKLKNPLGSDLKNLLYYKDGTNILWQSFLVIYYREVMKMYGRNITFFTGDGGDKVFPDHRSSINLSNVESLVKYIVSNKYFFTIKKISELLSINEKDFLNHLANYFSTYPESSSNYKFLRFIIMERGLKWLFETEDKNRFFFWSVAPMYSYPFFDYAMNIPDDLKTGYSLYHKFLSKINPISLEFKHATLRVPLNPDDLRYKTLIFAKDKLYPRFPSFIKRILRMRLTKIDQCKINDIPLLNSLVNDLLKKNSVTNIFNKTSILNLGSINKVEFYILLTLLNSVEYYFENASTLSDYISEEFP